MVLRRCRNQFYCSNICRVSIITFVLIIVVYYVVDHFVDKVTINDFQNSCIILQLVLLFFISLLLCLKNCDILWAVKISCDENMLKTIKVKYFDINHY